MQISMKELMVLIDTLNVSTSIIDNGKLFHYSRDARKELWERLNNRLDDMTFDVKEGSSGGS